MALITDPYDDERDIIKDFTPRQKKFLEYILENGVLRSYMLIKGSNEKKWYDFSTENGYVILDIREAGECWTFDIEVYLRKLLDEGSYSVWADQRILNSISYYVRNKYKIDRANYHIIN